MPHLEETRIRPAIENAGRASGPRRVMEDEPGDLKHYEYGTLIRYVAAGSNDKMIERHIEFCQVCRTIVRNIRETI
jgi:hypothetical protein